MEFVEKAGQWLKCITRDGDYYRLDLVSTGFDESGSHNQLGEDLNVE